MMYAMLIDGNVQQCGDRKWSKWFETADRVVRKTQIGDVLVSTVFLGINHGDFANPLWFETMVFGGEHDGDCWRYSNMSKAIEGHANALKEIGLGEG